MLEKWYPTQGFQKLGQIDEELQDIPDQGHLVRKRPTKLFDIQIAGRLLLAAVFLGSYAYLAYSAWRPDRRSACVLGNEAIFDDVPILHETRHFQRAGFHDLRHSSTTQYEGKPNEDNDHAWEHLLDAGVVTISKEENLRIANGSASTRHDPDRHIVQLEMFHQLHCLKWIRDRIWEPSTPELLGSQVQNHTDHCVDYLRQSIMCHGDITPIRFEWIPETGRYIATHGTEHVCRRFDAIYDWAKTRDTSGLRSGGNHMNVEFNNSDKFD